MNRIKKLLNKLIYCATANKKNSEDLLRSIDFRLDLTMYIVAFILGYLLCK